MFDEGLDVPCMVTNSAADRMKWEMDALDAPNTKRLRTDLKSIGDLFFGKKAIALAHWAPEY